MARWTESEIEYLSDNLGFKHYRELVKPLGRTERAIKTKCERIGLTLFDNIYTYSLLSEELGVCRYTLRKWYSKGLLKGQRATWRCKNGLAHEYPMIFSEENITEFIKTHGDKLAKILRGRVIPNLYFRNVMEAK